MITLANAVALKTVLGGTGTTDYDQFELSRIRFDHKLNAAHADIEVTASGNGASDAVAGELQIKLNAGTNGTLYFKIPQFDIYRTVALSAGQKSAVESIMGTAQGDLEAGLVTIGIIEKAGA